MADAILRQVITSWEPRIVNNGVDMNDYHWTVDGLEKWSEWYGAWMALGRKHEDLARDAEAHGHAVTAGEAYYRAAIAYHFGVFCWVDNLEELTAGHRKRVECYGKALGTLDPPGERVEIPLEGITIPGYLRKPRGVSRPPVVLFLSGLDSAKEEHATFEIFFLRRGLATLAIDGPGQGETWYRMKMRVDFEVAATAAIDWLRTRPDVDGTRVGVCGVSLGGYLAPRCAAFDPRFRAVASCGGLYSLQDRPLQSEFHLRRWLHIWGARDEAEVRRLSKGATLDGAAENIRMPLLIVHGEKDNLIPPADPYRTYEQASGPKRWVCYPEGNHVCNNIIYKYRPLVADFMAEHLT
jgi:2,6-dihydroxypseudooxynicotine hydrolase